MLTKAETEQLLDHAENLLRAACKYKPEDQRHKDFLAKHDRIIELIKREGWKAC